MLGVRLMYALKTAYVSPKFKQDFIMKLKYLAPKSEVSRPRFRVRLLKYDTDPMIPKYPQIKILYKMFYTYRDKRFDAKTYVDVMLFVKVARFWSRTIFRQAVDGAVIIREPDDGEDAVCYRTWWHKETLPRGWTDQSSRFAAPTS